MTGVTINRKRVLRVIRQMGALAQVRRHRAYTNYKAAVRRYENILNRQFEQRHNNLFWATTLHTYRHHKECVIYVRLSTNVVRWCWAIGLLRR